MLFAAETGLKADFQIYKQPHCVSSMQLPRNNCHIRANVILVAASGRAKVNTGVGVLFKIVACARMRFSSVR